MYKRIQQFLFVYFDILILNLTHSDNTHQKI